MSELTSTWECPSNIAIVKYWGKRGFQLPTNPSVSFTLSQCTTTTTVKAYEHPGRRKPEVIVYFEGEYHEAFSQRVKSYFHELAATHRWLKDYDFEIETSNNFPHGAGIASSASAFGALALCLTTLEQKLNPAGFSDEAAFYRRASFLSRIGSGSASRSVFGGWVIWGKTPALPQSDDKFAVKLSDENIHPLFKDLHDTILLISRDTKKVSSSVGHHLMNHHPYASRRFARANQNVLSLIEILRFGDWNNFAHMCEAEALDLHAMMMTSTPPYLLIKPESLFWIEKIREARLKENLPVTFTLDAGPNLHLIYPEAESEHVKQWLDFQKSNSMSTDLIFDRIGSGPIRKF